MTSSMDHAARACRGLGMLALLCLAGAQVPAWPADTTPDREALVNADYVRGRLAFQQRCSACHTLAEDGAHLVGPNLWGVVGRPAGGADGYAASDALKAAGFRWDIARLQAFIAGPQALVPGTTMAIPEPVPADDRIHLLSFMMLETGAADWPRPAAALADDVADGGRPPAERFPSFWNHLMTNTTRYRMETAEGETRFDIWFRTDGSLASNVKGIRGFWHIDERDFFCYALYGLPARPNQLVECFPVVAMSIPRFAEQLWTSKPVPGVTLHGGIVAGRP